MLPKALVPIHVFADKKGIGLTIEPARTIADNEPGPLIARLNSSPFNDLDIKIGVDPSTGFLSTVSANSDAQLLAIVEEAANSAERLAFQNSRATLLKNRMIVFEDNLDPLQQTDVDRINTNLDAVFKRAAKAWARATKRTVTLPPVKLSVVHFERDADITHSGSREYR